VSLLAAKKLLVTYSVSIDDLIILATVVSSSSSRDGGCLDFLEEDICCVDERPRVTRSAAGRNEMPVMYYITGISLASHCASPLAILMDGV
jgi:hypothetical protein